MSNGHVKFDAEESPVSASAVTDRQDDVLVISKKDKEVHSSSDEESDDDDAPQEEGLHSGKSEVEIQITQREEAIRLEQSQLRSKRRKQNELYAKQKKSVSETEVTDEVIAELPEELLKNIDQKDEGSTQYSSSRHVTFDKLDESDENEEALAKAIKTKKRKTLKNLRKDSVKRGKFRVQLLSTTQDSKTLPPKKESSIIRSKDRWLNRKALNKG
ncbi:CPS_HP_G0117660.mRNA.1.CDS.1 [Saccharomyces cerevisiae]|nr:CPS_HP_G0072470.mRNA.1.CDS.1 [Saccharomyces cerevisiae]CAI5001252.1 CPS_HP_G0076620.mRNA.1.CDS.1 [Saccharomyces cerevisiae]CAI5072187.1 CPS_HP_G0117660.mRNA.1.CDS.1 [Saccharomyces cerevisiae]CAI6886958.1 CPS_HP_G0072470.mRNA.1.CDS.1 [Saccharomyces cerevisiae]CAI6907558.1 CPS_HP_G0076620.mRNA.1.CDS.1 [Saccharomyces cerevisiae]